MCVCVVLVSLNPNVIDCKLHINTLTLTRSLDEPSEGEIKFIGK